VLGDRHTRWAVSAPEHPYKRPVGRDFPLSSPHVPSTSQRSCSPPRARSLSSPLLMITILPDRGRRLHPSGPRSLSSLIPLGLMPLTLFPVMQKKRPFVRRGGSEASIRCSGAKTFSVQSGSSAHPAKGTLVPSETAGNDRAQSLTTMHVRFRAIFGAYTHLACLIARRAALARAQSQLPRAVPSAACSRLE
jgi:hypothetical protein